MSEATFDEKEVAYRTTIEPAVWSILESISRDLQVLGIDGEDFLRGVWLWADMNLADRPIPEWLRLEIERRQAGEG